jgi:Restriction endonuclease
MRHDHSRRAEARTSVTYLAINLIKRRLKDAFGEKIGFEEKGQPTDFESAKRLAELDKFQFQHWALSLIGARPRKEGESKGADRGVDGLLYYYETERKDLINRINEDAPAVRSEPVHREKIIVQVKGGGVNRGDVAILLGDVENQKAAGGVLITLEKPSKQMRTEAAEAGRYSSKLWHDILTPDLYATKGASAALLEVKTIAASDNDVTRFKLHEARTAVYGLPTTFKQKVRRTLATAVDQLDSYSRGTVNRRICMLRIRLDLDVDLPAQNHIELQSFIRSLSTPAIEVVYEEYP